MSKLLPNLVVASLVVLAACATQKAAEKTDAKADAVEKIELSNVSAFDVAACRLRPLELPAMTQETIIAALIVGQPSFMECLLEAKTRSAVGATKVTVKATASDAEVKLDVSGDGLMEDGKACIVAAAKKLPLRPVEKGAATVTAEISFLHDSAKSPSVTFGINPASDVVGTVRAAQLSWCDCYGDLGTTPPPTIKAQLHFVPVPKDKDGKSTGTTLDLQMEPGPDPLATKLSACLEGKLKAATLPVIATELHVPYAFLLINSWASAETPDAAPAFQFHQLEAIRMQRGADVAMQLGARTHATLAYDAVVAKYKTKPVPTLIKELKSKCAAVLATDDKWIASLKELLAVDQRVVALAADLVAKDPQWAQAEAGGKTRVTQAQADVAQAEQRKVADTAACPKSN